MQQPPSRGSICLIAAAVRCDSADGRVGRTFYTKPGSFLRGMELTWSSHGTKRRQHPSPSMHVDQRRDRDPIPDTHGGHGIQEETKKEWGNAACPKQGPRKRIKGEGVLEQAVCIRTAGRICLLPLHLQRGQTVATATTKRRVFLMKFKTYVGRVHAKGGSKFSYGKF